MLPLPLPLPVLLLPPLGDTPPAPTHPLPPTATMAPTLGGMEDTVPTRNHPDHVPLTLTRTLMFKPATERGRVQIRRVQGPVERAGLLVVVVVVVEVGMEEGGG